jgi:long-chain acyl-CoA synthetase
MPESFTTLLANRDELLKPDSSQTGLAIDMLEQAENLLSSPDGDQVSPDTWREYLEISGDTVFLQKLADEEQRNRWAATAFQAIDLGNYTLKTLMDARIAQHPEKPLFKDFENEAPIDWSYRYIAERIRTIAAMFHRTSPDPIPRVAILSGNSVDGACCDLACLMHGIFVTPLNVHFDAETLGWIFERLHINIVVTDTDERYRRLRQVRKDTGVFFHIVVLHNRREFLKDPDQTLEEACAQLSDEDITEAMESAPGIRMHETATIMFTSGSTGRPKGVVFDHYALITKRFARAAALPEVGRDETLLCFLPLYHTFGRYLEMLGSIYWGGTYVFVGNPSSETLLARMTQVHPTGLISIPLRWEQIFEECLKRSTVSTDAQTAERAFREVVGAKLRWGLSAAGFLHPRVFRFFQKRSVQLCSGFGMTEATGGITMTPPGGYQKHSVGIPLPGIQMRLSDQQELQISGPYVVRYLEEEECEADIATPTDKYWLETGDLFEELPDGHLRIVDRIKDIYKNSRGQTIAPLRVEQKFNGVPGIKRTFLVGDGRDYNALLIVPDHDDPMLHEPTVDGKIETYFRQIIIAANKELAPYERVINISLLERDFDPDLGELTPKGSFNRKTIEQNYIDIIEGLYQNNFVQLTCDHLTVCIPRWFFRDMGILEGDIVVQSGGLFNRNTNQFLRLCHGSESGAVIVGDLEYRITGDTVDLDLFARQPRLWMGNPALLAFCPCKDGWDLPTTNISHQVLLPWRNTISREIAPCPAPPEDAVLAEINTLIITAQFADTQIALPAIKALDRYLLLDDERITGVIRLRLEALARHPEESVRCLAYRILLLDEPILDYSHLLPAFVQSGLSFLNETSIQDIARKNIGKQRLEALRQRLYSYRTQLSWPATAATRRQFERIFRLLVNYVKHSPEYYAPVRAELASWILHRADENLAATAEKYFDEMAEWFQNRLAEDFDGYPLSEWRSKVEIGDEITMSEIEKLEEVLIGTTFLKQAVMLAYDLDAFDLHQVLPGGIWISRFLPRGQHNLYRISINMQAGNHYELLLAIRSDITKQSVLQTRYWMIALAGHPFGAPSVPRFGCCRPDLGALALVYLSELTVWEKIREMSSRHHSDTIYPRSSELQKLYIRALTTFFTGWRNSNFQIVAGAVSLDNVAVPEPDFVEGASTLSLTGWYPYKNPLSLIRPMIQNCYRKTSAHYPWTSKHLKVQWIFDACFEALGLEKATAFLGELQVLLRESSIYNDYGDLSGQLDTYLRDMARRYHPPLLLQNAIDHFEEWTQLNPKAEPAAKAGQAAEVYDHYQLERYPDIAHYHLYRHTYFVNAEPAILEAFDRLLEAMFQSPLMPAGRLLELYHVQAVLEDADDRRAFNSLVFPQQGEPHDLDMFVVGDSEDQQVVLQSHINDKQNTEYIVRPPLEPAEVGQIIRMFIREKVPGRLSENDEYVLVIDAHDRIAGGICYRMQDRHVAYLDAITITSPLRGQGLATALLEDFCTRMMGQGVHIITAKFLPRNFYMDRGFQVNKRWGGLVRFLKKSRREEDAGQPGMLHPLPDAAETDG